MRLVWLKDELLKAANDEIKSAERESWEDEPELIPNMQVYHYHNDHLGTPNELTNQQGEVVWLADYEAWGNTAKVVWRKEKLEQLQVSADELQPIRFQGQSFDENTGLHYNRYRYFDPDLGMFISRDPIGLVGGNNVFQYAPNPTGWIDPFGLASAKVHAQLYANTVLKQYTALCKKPPTAVAAVIHRASGDRYYGESGHNNKVTNPTLIKNMPRCSKELWAVENCAEVDALIKAFRRRPYAKMSDFEISAATVKTGKTKKPCDNCKITTAGCK